MAKKNDAPTAVNSAPNYQPPAPGGQPAPQWQPPAPGNGAGAAFTAPPVQGERNPFLNAQWLWQNGDQSNALRPVVARIVAVRQAFGGNPQYQNRGGFFLDLVLQNGTKLVARVNIGDQRHQRLYSKFGANLVGQVVTFRLSHPGDQTKGPWTVDC